MLVNTQQDSSFIAEMDAESFVRYYRPRVWRVNNQSIATSIYGEPGQTASGADGVTSVAATRRLTSASADFVTAGVKANDVVEVYHSDVSADNGRYKVASVVDLHTLTISEDWPDGGNTGLGYIVFLANEQYTAMVVPVPFQLKLDPSEQDLKKWGMESKSKPIDALIKLSILLCDRIGFVPKVGDRFDNEYNSVTQQYEVLTLIKRDQAADSSIPIHYIGSATKTRDIY